MEFEVGNETLALLGQSGCGKTMTLKCIAGIERPDEGGEIILNNRVLFSSKKKINLLPKERKVGLLFQNYALFPNMTLEENIAIGVPKNTENKKKKLLKKKNPGLLSRRIRKELSSSIIWRTAAKDSPG